MNDYHRHHLSAMLDELGIPAYGPSQDSLSTFTRIRDALRQLAHQRQANLQQNELVLDLYGAFQEQLREPHPLAKKVAMQRRELRRLNDILNGRVLFPNEQAIENHLNHRREVLLGYLHLQRMADEYRTENEASKPEAAE